MNTEEQQILNLKVRYEDAIYGIVRYKEKLAELSKAQEELKENFKNGKVTYDEYATSLAAIDEQVKTHKGTIRELSKEIQNNIKTEREQEGSLRSLRAELSNATKEYDSLSRAEREGAKGQELKKHINEITNELKTAEEQTQRFQRNVGNYEGSIKSALGVNNEFANSILNMSANGKGLKGVFDGAITNAKAFGTTLMGLMTNPVFLALAGIAGAGVAFKWFYDYNKGILESTRLTREFTGLTGKELKSFRDEVQATADTYGKNFQETLEAVDTLKAQYGYNEKEALKIINDGFQAGADLHGDMIDKIKQYAPAFHDAKISGQELVATIQQTRSGIFSDGGLALIQMGSKKIREMSSSTAKALDDIGISSKKVQKDLRDGTKSTFDVLKEISTKMKTIPHDSKEMGAVLKDVFGKQGANAGIKMIEQLDTMNVDLNKLKDTTGKWGEKMNAQRKANAELNKTMSALFDMSDKGFGGMISQVKLLTTQGITALLKGLISTINYFIDMYNQSMLFRAGIHGLIFDFKYLWNTCKLVFNLIIDNFKALGRFAKAWGDIIEGVATFSFDKIKKGVNGLFTSYTSTIKEAWGDVKSFAKDTAQNYIDAINSTIKGNKTNHIEIPTYISEPKNTVNSTMLDKIAKENEKFAKLKEMLAEAKDKDSSADTKSKSNGKSKGGGSDKKTSAEEMAKKEVEAIRRAEDLLTEIIEQTEEERRKAIELGYNRQIADVKKRLDTEKGLTTNARKALTAQMQILEQIKDKKLSEFDVTVKEEKIKREEEYYKNMLETVEKGSKEEYNLKIKLINDEYQLELEEARRKVMSEEEKNNLLNSITEKFYQKQEDARKEYHNKLIEEQEKAIGEKFKKSALEIELNGDNEDGESKELQLLRLRLEEKQALLESAQQKEGETIEAFELRKLELKKNAVEAEKNLKNGVIEEDIKSLENFGNAISTAQSLAEAFSGKSKTLAQASKALALAEIAINSGVAVAKAIKSSADVPFPANLAAIGTAVSTVLAGITSATKTVNSAKFADGGLVQGAGSGTSDSIPAHLSNGESVLTASATSMFAPALSAFNQIGGGVPIVMNNMSTQQQIGEEFLARAVARGMALAPRPVVSVEEVTNVKNRVEAIERLSTLG